MVRTKKSAKKGPPKRPRVYLISLSPNAVELKNVGNRSLPPEKFYIDNNEFYFKHRLGFMKMKKDDAGKVAFWVTKKRVVVVSTDDI